VEISNSVIIICLYDLLPIQTPTIVTNTRDNIKDIVCDIVDWVLAEEKWGNFVVNVLNSRLE
jgi:hypothetical protein